MVILALAVQRFAADTLLYSVTLTLNICSVYRGVVMKLCTKFERNRAIRGGVIVLSIFDLRTLNAV